MAEVIKTIIDVDINTGAAAQQLRNLQQQINAFNLTLNKGQTTQAQAAKVWAGELAAAVNRTKFFRAEVVKMQTAANALDSTLKKGQASLGQFFSAAFNRRSAMAAETFALAAERARTMQTQFIATGKAAKGMQDALAIRPLTAFVSEASIASQRMQILSSMFRQGTTQLINFGKNVQWAGRQLMVGFTVPLTIFGTTAGRVFMDLEKQVVSFKKVYGDLFTTPKELEDNLKAVQGLAAEYTKYGVAVKDTIGLAAQAAAAGRRNADLTDAVSQATRLATLGQMEQNAALDATIALQSAFRLSGQELADTINYLNMVENQTVVSLQDISAAIPRVAPVIKGLGGDVKDLTVFLAAMQEGGVSAEQGANALKSGLASLVNPTKAANETLAGFNINLNAIVEANRGDLMGVVMDFSKALQTLDEFSRQQALEKVFGKFQYARLGALFENIGRKGSQASQVMETMQYSSEQLAATANKELKTIEDSFGVQLIAAIEKFKLSIAPIGQLFVKMAIPIVQFITKITNWFNSLPEGVKNIAAIATVITGVVVPAATMLFGLFMNLVGTLAKMSQGAAIFGATLLKRGPIAALKSLTQSSKYLSLAEIDAANAAQQLGSSTSIANTALLNQKGISNDTSLAIRNLTGAYRELIAEQMRAAAVQNAYFGPGLSAANLSKSRPRARIKGIGLNQGNIVPGVGNTDTVPAMLTPGEFVVNKEATKNNLGLLHQINSQKLNSGGKVKGMQYFAKQNKQRVVQDPDFIRPQSGAYAPSSQGKFFDHDKLLGEATQKPLRVSSPEAVKLLGFIADNYSSNTLTEVINEAMKGSHAKRKGRPNLEEISEAIKKTIDNYNTTPIEDIKDLGKLKGESLSNLSHVGVGSRNITASKDILVGKGHKIPKGAPISLLSDFVFDLPKQLNSDLKLRNAKKNPTGKEIYAILNGLDDGGKQVLNIMDQQFATYLDNINPKNKSELIKSYVESRNQSFGQVMETLETMNGRLNDETFGRIVTSKFKNNFKRTELRNFLNQLEEKGNTLRYQNKPQLIETARRLGLSTSGSRDDLFLRIMQNEDPTWNPEKQKELFKTTGQEGKIGAATLIKQSASSLTYKKFKPGKLLFRNKGGMIPGMQYLNTGGIGKAIFERAKVGKPRIKNMSGLDANSMNMIDELAPFIGADAAVDYARILQQGNIKVDIGEYFKKATSLEDIVQDRFREWKSQNQWAVYSPGYQDVRDRALSKIRKQVTDQEFKRMSTGRPSLIDDYNKNIDDILRYNKGGRIPGGPVTLGRNFYGRTSKMVSDKFSQGLYHAGNILGDIKARGTGSRGSGFYTTESQQSAKIFKDNFQTPMLYRLGFSDEQIKLIQDGKIKTYDHSNPVHRKRFAEELGIKTDTVPDINDEVLFEKIRQDELKKLGYDVGVFPLENYKLPKGMKNEFELGSNEIVFYTKKMLPSKVTPQKLNAGNIVPGVGNTDKVPAMLTPGEFVVNKEATANNLDLLHAINGTMPVQRLVRGGEVIGYDAKGKAIYDKNTATKLFNQGQLFAQPGGKGLITNQKSFEKRIAAVKPVPRPRGAGAVGMAAGLAASMPFMTEGATENFGTMGSMVGSIVAWTAAQSLATKGMTKLSQNMAAGNKGMGSLVSKGIEPLKKSMSGALTAIKGLARFNPYTGTIIAVGTGLMLLTKTLDKIRNSGADLSNAMYGSKESLDAMAAAFGRTTNSQNLLQQQAETIAGQATSEQAIQASSQFAASEQGKSLLQQMQLVKKEGQNVATALRNQLAQAVLAGVLTPEEARQVALDIGLALKDKRISLDVVGQLTTLLGPNGEMIKENRISIMSEISAPENLQEISKQVEDQFKKIKKSTFNPFDPRFNAGDAIKRAASFFATEEVLKREMQLVTLRNNVIQNLQKEKELRSGITLELQQGLITYQEYSRQINQLNTNTTGRQSVRSTLNTIGQGQDLRGLRFNAGTGARGTSNPIAQTFREIGMGIQGKGRVETNFNIWDNVKKQFAIKQAEDFANTLTTSMNAEFEAIGLDEGTRQDLLDFISNEMGFSLQQQAELFGQVLSGEMSAASLLFAKQIAPEVENFNLQRVAKQLDPFVNNQGMLATAQQALTSAIPVRGQFTGESDADFLARQKTNLQQLEALPPEITKTLKIDVQSSLDVSKFGPMADDLRRSWNMLEDLDPSVDKEAVFKLISTDSRGIARDPMDVLDDADAINQAVSDLTSGSKSQKAEAELKLSALYNDMEIGDPKAKANLDDLKSRYKDWDKFEGGTKEALIRLDAEIEYTDGLISTLEEKKKRGTITDAELDELAQLQRERADLTDQAERVSRKGSTTATGDGEETAFQRISKDTKATKDYQKAIAQLTKQGIAGENIALVDQTDLLEMSTSERKKAIQMMKEQQDIQKMLAVALLSDEDQKIRLTQNALKIKENEINQLNRQIEDVERLNRSEQNRIDNLERQNELDGRQVELRNRALSEIADKEKQVNEQYDLREKALNKVAQMNDRIAEQQQNRIALASALTGGDFAAAAGAAAGMTAGFASNQIQDAQEALRNQRENELASLTANVNGQLLTRVQIEQQIDDINERVYQRNQSIQQLQDIIYNREQALKPIRDDIFAKEGQRLQLSRELEDAEFNKWKTEQDGINSAILSWNEYWKARRGQGGSVLKSSYEKARSVLSKVTQQKKAFGGMINYTGSREAPPTLKANLGMEVPGTGLSDKVPALLTPGEFVVRKSAAQANMPLLKSINSNVFPKDLAANMSTLEPVQTTNAVSNVSAPVYNYSVNVNVTDTNASPNEIADVVINKIKMSQNRIIRGNRF